MKRKLLSLLLALSLMLALVPTAGAAFSDISDSEVALAAATLQGFGVVDGTGGNNFNPNGTLTRAQACKLIVGVMGLSSHVSTYARKTLFSDVSPSAWYNGYVNLAYAKGVINGLGNGTFGPNDPITYGQMATIALRLLGYTSAEIGTVWPLDYTNFADDLGLNGSLTLSANQSLTRGQAAVLLANTLRADTADGKDYYQTISTVKSATEAVLMDASATYSGSTGLLMAYTLDGSGVQYYTQANTQSDALAGSVGVLLFDGSGRVIGFVPESTDYLDLKISSATATTLTAASGKSYRISSGAKVIAAGEIYPYASTGYLYLNNQNGKTVRMFYDDNSAVTYLYLTGGTSTSSQAVVATSASATSLARKLDISDTSYKITKNGVNADAGDIAANDVAYYDAASGTMRVSDYRVTGYIESATPSVSAATSITVAGCTFSVLESAWNTLSGFQIGSRITLLLTDDCKVAAASSSLSADMIGVLSTDGRSVTLTGSGAEISAQTMSYDSSLLGSLVRVSVSSASAFSCYKVSSTSKGKLDIEARTLGSVPLASSCAVYEWAGSGYVYSLEGEEGAASYDFTSLDWTDAISASRVSYAHTNSAGQVDVLLLNDVTSSAYQYGTLTLYTDNEGIKLSGGNEGGNSGNSSDSYNTAGTLTNADGTTSKFLCTISANSGYCGVILSRYDSSYKRVVSVQQLSRVSADAEDFFLSDGDWYADVNGTEYRISDTVQIHISDSSRWLSGEEGLASVLADGCNLTLYYDRAPSEGGQVRIIKATHTS